MSDNRVRFRTCFIQVKTNRFSIYLITICSSSSALVPHPIIGACNFTDFLHISNSYTWGTWLRQETFQMDEEEFLSGEDFELGNSLFCVINTYKDEKLQDYNSKWERSSGITMWRIWPGTLRNTAVYPFVNRETEVCYCLCVWTVLLF